MKIRQDADSYRSARWPAQGDSFFNDGQHRRLDAKCPDTGSEHRTRSRSHGPRPDPPARLHLTYAFKIRLQARVSAARRGHTMAAVFDRADSDPRPARGGVPNRAA